MRTKSVKRTVSLVAAAALVIAGASAASAATIEEVPFADIQDFDDGVVYKGWHQEREGANDSYDWSADPAGVRLGFNGPAQLFNGLVEAGDPGIPTNVDDLAGLIQNANVEVEVGVVSFQIGLFQDYERSKWTTLRPVTDGADLADPNTLWRGTGNWHDYNFTLSDLGEILETDTVYVTGYGVHAENEAVVSSITWGGTTFQFVEELTEVEDPEVEDGENGDDNDEENGDEVNEDGGPDDGNASETGDETSADDGDAAAATPVSGSPSYTG